jgi:hypothetical protein
MSPNPTNVRKLDIQPLDFFRKAILQGLYRLKITHRSIKFDFWRGSVVAEENTTTLEPANDRH